MTGEYAYEPARAPQSGAGGRLAARTGGKQGRKPGQHQVSWPYWPDEKWA